MKANEKLQDIAEAEGLQLIETTCERNGYPRALRYAVIGFDDFAHAERVAEKYGCRIEEFKRETGWQLWYRTGDRAFEAIKTDPEDFGPDTRAYFAQSSEDIFKEEVKPLLEEAETLEEASAIIQEYTKLCEKMQMLEEDEIILYFGHGNMEVHPLSTMDYHYDNKQIAIGCICDDDDDEEDDE